MAVVNDDVDACVGVRGQTRRLIAVIIIIILLLTLLLITIIIIITTTLLKVMRMGGTRIALRLMGRNEGWRSWLPLSATD